MQQARDKVCGHTDNGLVNLKDEVVDLLHRVALGKTPFTRTTRHRNTGLENAYSLHLAGDELGENQVPQVALALLISTVLFDIELSGTDFKAVRLHVEERILGVHV